MFMINNRINIIIKNIKEILSW